MTMQKPPLIGAIGLGIFLGLLVLWAFLGRESDPGRSAGNSQDDPQASHEPLLDSKWSKRESAATQYLQ